MWKTETVSNFTYTEVTSGSLLNGTSSRPQIVCTRYGKIYVIYRTTEDGLDGQIRAIDVTTPGKPVDYLLTRFNANRTELSVNVWEVLQTGTLSMMLYNGVNRVAANLEGSIPPKMHGCFRLSCHNGRGDDDYEEISCGADPCRRDETGGAALNNEPVGFSMMAVGDGGGMLPDPVGRIALVNERFRARSTGWLLQTGRQMLSGLK